uniref:Uncharacterized protein n=1 Tax=Tolypothrix bouteillei VB521301 TaxID=1479485 RepID=A0A0C1QR20_9CYAN
MLQIVQTQLNIFLYGKNQSITNKEKVLSTEVGENQTANVLSLIWEAIHYFFGEQRNKSFEQTDPSISSDRSLPEERKLHRQFQFSGQSPSSKALPETSQFQDGETVDPWLTMDDLFNHSPQIYEVNREPQISESSSNTNFTLPETFSERENIWHYFQSKTSKLKKMLGSVNRQISDLGLPQSAKKRRNHNSRQKLRIGTNSSSSFQKLMVGNFDSQITDFDSQKTTGEATKSYRETEAIEAKPDWIETSARTIGYVKHPLEFILEWLDRAILWLERILVNIFLFFKGLLHGK